MKVKKMIELLTTYNPEADVRMHHMGGEQALFVLGVVGDTATVWIESESDNDMGVELEARFETAMDDFEDELDFYMDLLETGIDVEMVRKYMGDDYADSMQRFCEEHGLI